MSGVDDAAAALPAYLNNFAVFDEDGDVAVAAVEGAHAGVCLGIGVDVVLGEIAACPFEPVAEFAGVGALG